MKRPIAIRWNSLYDSWQQLIRLENKLKGFFEVLNLEESLTSRDFKFMREYLQCTAPIADALDKLQGEKNVTFGHLLPTIISARVRLRKLLECQNTEDEKLEYCKELIPVLISSLETRFENFFGVVDEGRSAAVAAATHPQFKLRWIKCLTATARENAMSAIKGLACCCPPRPQQSTIEAMETSNDGFDFDDEMEDIPIVQNLGTPAYEDEFERFCQDKQSDLSILHFYPIVLSTFIKFNTPLPSSAPVERMFNLATMFNIGRFNRLND